MMLGDITGGKEKYGKSMGFLLWIVTLKYISVGI